MTHAKGVLRFRITLLEVEPAVWRQIEVPESYSFWDLHVAIQDAMGWQDYHLHMFHLPGSEVPIGIPDEREMDDYVIVPGWELKIEKLFTHQQPLARYEYDFGDCWRHSVEFEGRQEKKSGQRYPRCLDGARRCPPEDCGGVPGYRRFLEILADPSDPEHEQRKTWVGGSFDPEEFDATRIKFDNPRTRWKRAFEGAAY